MGSSLMILAVAGILSYQDAATEAVVAAPAATTAVTVVTPIPAPEPAPRNPELTHREDWVHIKNGHTFLPNLVLGSPFVDTNLNLANAVGVVERDITFLNRTRTLQLAGVAPQFSGQLRLWKRLGIGAGVVGNVVAGTNTVSVAAYGSSVAYVARGSLLLGLVDTKTTALTFSLDMLKPKRLTVSPLQVLGETLRGLANRGNPDFVDDKVATQWRPTFRLAYAISPAFGLRGQAGWSYNVVHENEAETQLNKLIAGGGIEVDLRHLITVPVGFSANYVRNQAVDEGSSTNTFTAGVYETTRAWTNFGLEGGVASAEGVKTYIGALVMRTYYE